VWWWRVTALRPIAGPFVVAAPAGARVRARLRVSGQDEAVLRAVGSHLGSLAGRDLAARCAEGWLDANGRAASRARRKRALTAQSSSRWVGTITRTSEDQWQLARQNLRANKSSLHARIRTIEARLACPAGGKAGRARGYATPAERHAKAVRLQSLRARLAAVNRRLEAGTVSVVRGGRPLLRTRGHLTAAGLTEEQWRGQWESARLFLTADGEKDKAWGNETIRWHPDEGWLEIRLPAPLASLANRPHGRYRLSCPVEFSYRGDEVAAQAATGALRYDISHDPARDRWYIDASWRIPPGPAPALEDLRQAPVLAVDLNHGHLAAWVVTPDGNPAGPPVTIPLVLAGLPASRRDGRLRAAISSLTGLARQHGCRGGRNRGPGLHRGPRAGPRAGGPPTLPRPARPGLPTAGLGHPHRKVPGSPHPDGRQRRPGGDCGRPGLHLPLGPRALAHPPARPDFPDPHRPSRGRRGDRQACARPPGAATGRRDRRRPADRPPESCPPSTRGQASGQERQAPPGPAAATPVAQDRDGRPDTPARPGDPGPFGAAGQQDYALLAKQER
jgi:hypothetical protein